MGSERLKLISANVRGLRQYYKRIDFFESCKGLKPDIICLQETHLIKKNPQYLTKRMECRIHLGGGVHLQ